MIALNVVIDVKPAMLFLCKFIFHNQSFIPVSLLVLVFV